MGRRSIRFTPPRWKYIGKGKPHKPYEFGVKVNVATTVKHAGAGSSFVTHVAAVPGNPYDGHTPAKVIPAMEAAGDYRDILRAAAISQSMSRKANFWDNAPMECFFGTLKTERVHEREYPDRDAARRDLFACIEGYYNRRRIHSAIGYIIPELADVKAA